MTSTDENLIHMPTKYSELLIITASLRPERVYGPRKPSWLERTRAIRVEVHEQLLHLHASWPASVAASRYTTLSCSLSSLFAAVSRARTPPPPAPARTSQLLRRISGMAAGGGE